MAGNEDAEAQQKNFRPPFSGHHPIPTVQKYRKEKEEREAEYGGAGEGGSSRTQRAKDAYERYKNGPGDQGEDGGPYQSENKNVNISLPEDDGAGGGPVEEHPDEPDNPEGVNKDTSEASSSAQDAKTQRKEMKKRKGDGAEREVTDPITHLPVKIKDFTDTDLNKAPENEHPPGLQSRVGTGISEHENPEEDPQIQEDAEEQQEAHSALDKLFPPPNFDEVKKEISRVYEKAIVVGMAAVATSIVGVTLVCNLTGVRNLSTATYSAVFIVIGGTLSIFVTRSLQQWIQNKVNDVWENETWEAERESAKKSISSHKHVAESTEWLNSLFASIWPLVNPDLFTSVADTLEDVMQASLPSLVRMVSIEDIGQGSESLRILGVKWLPSGAAGHSVGKDGKLEVKKPDNKSNSDDTSKNENKESESEQNNDVESMEAEDGDFINMEIAFSYRARGGGKAMRSRARHAHLYLAFYLFGGIRFPVWVELHGLVGVLRMRLQLTPDPPFFSLCTLTFMGQPKVDVSCVPLSKHALNVMDLPVISGFVQSAVDAGLSTLVAPHSMTLDLKDMLVGEDFKKNTAAKGALMVTIKRGFEFKEGDSGLGPLKKGSSDPYVTLGWAKFGKPVWSTRVMLSEMEPWWQETAFILVTEEELNVEERLRVELFDSDRTSADDSLGRIEIDLKHIMRSDKANGKMWDRQDGFTSLKNNESMPGKLEWSVGYFSKTRILDKQLAAQTSESDVNSVDDLKKQSDAESEQKLREAKGTDHSGELEQQKQQDFKERQDHIMTESPALEEYPTGILSIQIHQIAGLELEVLNKNRSGKKENSTDEEEDGEDLPSAYCTIILNHSKVYKTRTKPKNAKPFFNAGTERLVRDWRNCEVHIAVRDSRVREDDPLLGIIYLPLGKILAKRSQLSEYFPLSGGIGYGKARISIVFRSIKLQAPRELLGWDFGTLEIQPNIKATDNLPSDLQNHRLKLRTSLGRVKMYPQSDSTGTWAPKKKDSSKIAVRKRYASNLIIEFRSDSALRDNTAAFCVLWLKDIPDDSETTLTLPVWRGKEGLPRAEQNCLDTYGERIGSLRLTLTFWSGLSGYHARLAAKDGDIGNVMEVLDTAVNNDGDDMRFADDDDNGSTSSSSSSDSDSSDDSDTPTSTRSGTSADDDGKRGLVDSLKDYKHNRKHLHRKNRGLMQYKPARTLNFVKNKVQEGGASVTSLFKHSDREPGVETEV